MGSTPISTTTRYSPTGRSAVDAMSEGALRILANTVYRAVADLGSKFASLRSLWSWPASSARASSGSSPSDWPRRSSPRSASDRTPSSCARLLRDHKQIDLYFANTLAPARARAAGARARAGGRLGSGSRAGHTHGDRPPGHRDHRRTPHHDLLRRLPGVRAPRLSAGRPDHAADRHRRGGHARFCSAPMSSSSPRRSTWAALLLALVLALWLVLRGSCARDSKSTWAFGCRSCEWPRRLASLASSALFSSAWTRRSSRCSRRPAWSATTGRPTACSRPLSQLGRGDSRLPGLRGCLRRPAGAGGVRPRAEARAGAHAPLGHRRGDSRTPAR